MSWHYHEEWQFDRKKKGIPHATPLPPDGEADGFRRRRRRDRSRSAQWAVLVLHLREGNRKWSLLL
jgi:hypothetical protein